MPSHEGPVEPGFERCPHFPVFRVCLECGSVVWDVVKHFNFHQAYPGLADEDKAEGS